MTVDDKRKREPTNFSFYPVKSEPEQSVRNLCGRVFIMPTEKRTAAREKPTAGMSESLGNEPTLYRRSR